MNDGIPAHIIITIDGPAGVGKTTLAKEIAQELDLPYLDTGAMFRFLACRLGEEALEWPEDILKNKLEEFTFSIIGTGSDTNMLCNGEAGNQALRNEKIGNLASKLASLSPVREKLRKEQQKIGAQHSLVAEGRDMGTTIFPGAQLKFFLDASPSVRAKRRYLQLLEKGEAPSLEELTTTIKERDERDRTRKIAPLQVAPDAHIINTDNLDLNATLNLMRGIYKPVL